MISSMTEGQAKAPGSSAVPSVMSSKNRVPEMIRLIQAAKSTGKFTFQAGRYVNEFSLR